VDLDRRKWRDFRHLWPICICNVVQGTRYMYTAHGYTVVFELTMIFCIAIPLSNIMLCPPIGVLLIIQHTEVSLFRNQINYQSVSPCARVVAAWPALVTKSCQLNWTPAQSEKKARTLQPAGTSTCTATAASDVNKETRCVR